MASVCCCASAASNQAVTNSFEEIAANRESQKALIGFAVDLAFAAVPLGDIASKGVKGALAHALPAGQIRTAVEGLSDEVINEGSTLCVPNIRQVAPQGLIVRIECVFLADEAEHIELVQENKRLRIRRGS